MDPKDNKAGNPGATAPGIEGNKSGTSTDNGGNGSGTPTDESAKQIADLKAQLAKSESDKDVYRAGLLAAKQLGGKAKKLTPEDLADPEKLESAIDAKIQDKELEKKALDEATQKVADSEALRLENEELKRSLEAAKTAGFQGGVSGGAGVNEHSETRPNTYWTDAQRNELRNMYVSRNLYTAEQIEKMVKKAEEIARNKTATASRNNDLVKTRQY